jgi:hypothetical protein
VIDGIDYVDTGDFSDEIAGDGVYTSLSHKFHNNQRNL